MENGFESRIELYRATNQANGNETVQEIAELIYRALQSGNTIYMAGNGGSASESSHFTAELVGRFLPGDRKALRAISLNSDTTVITAIGNDFGFDKIYSRQIEALGKKDDVVICLSTSGTSPNIVELIDASHKIGIKTVLLTGALNKTNLPLCDIVFKVNTETTALVQEVHLSIIHMICSHLEELYKINRTKKEVKKIIELRNLEIQENKRPDIVWVNGCFDVLHRGHISFLREAASLGNELWVGLNSDKSIKQLKGPHRPIQQQLERAETLALLPWVSRIIIFDETSPSQAIYKIRPQIIVKSKEYISVQIPEESAINSLNIEVVYLDKIDGISTSNLVSQIVDKTDNE